jgi:hypothetical protein
MIGFLCTHNSQPAKINNLMRCKFFITITLFFLTFLSSAWPQTAIDIPSRYEFSLEIPPRLQWGANFGYCGEMSFISAGLFFGQYCSQFEARRLASPGKNQSLEISQLLLGASGDGRIPNNDELAAKSMHLQYEAWHARTEETQAFLGWVKKNLTEGFPVIIGVFENQSAFGDKNLPMPDSTYDHIVPLFAFGSNKPFLDNRGEVYESDVIHFSDNGLYSSTNYMPYHFSYRLDTFQKTRNGANLPQSPIYSVKLGKGANYGIAIKGVADRNGDTLPVMVQTNLNYEKPEMVDKSNTPPKPMLLELTVRVSIPNQNESYNLYMYDQFQKVPESQFNASSSKAVKAWKIPAKSGPFYEIKIPNFSSNKVAVFRAVSTKAP